MTCSNVILDLFPYQDKQEIKTVRIVKRESERRQRDKDKTGGPLIGSNMFDRIAELQSSDELNEYLSTTYTSEPPIGSCSYRNEDDALMSDDELCLSPSVAISSKMSFKSSARVASALKNISIDRNASIGSSCTPSTDYFQSNAARQIHNEMSVNTDNNAQTTVAMNKHQLTDLANQHKRNVARKKKRHNTAPNSVHSEGFNDYLATQNASKQVNLSFDVCVNGKYMYFKLYLYVIKCQSNMY